MLSWGIKSGHLWSSQKRKSKSLDIPAKWMTSSYLRLRDRNSNSFLSLLELWSSARSWPGSRNSRTKSSAGWAMGMSYLTELGPCRSDNVEGSNSGLPRCIRLSSGLGLITGCHTLHGTEPEPKDLGISWSLNPPWYLGVLAVVDPTQLAEK